MKVLPTLEGGLRIDTNDASDWDLLRCVIHDANGRDVDLATRLGDLISPEAGGEDWEEYVVPDLREEFQDELSQIHALIESAAFKAGGGAGSLWIHPEDAFTWYGSFNQARLAIEDSYHFTGMVEQDLMKLTPEQQAAYIRSDFYGHIQILLLKHALH
ncbi:hypothetical protein JIN84_04785 [Luteolibacter yonseiensis]|uniref:Uncharacterized protein n=1 Tax=Luteolibacter yonseiensis TaxID=1144680 RepID=A0A934R2J3_9BACT|nr:hypothetical protein [Luteolibacter yonseiensis]MBK1814918.1 hypothetical protein [Luteolibacter yonseiensis]